MNKTVHIIGKGGSWIKAPFTKGAETWGVNDIILRRAVSKVFSIHDFTKNCDCWLDDDAKLRIKRMGVPLITIKKLPDVPTSIEYPLSDIIEHFENKGYYPADYFSNTIDYMIAYAVYCGFKRICLYGVGLLCGSKCEYEKPGIESWIRVAQGEGVRVEIVGQSRLFKVDCLPGHEQRRNKLYGYWTEQRHKIHDGLIYE